MNLTTVVGVLVVAAAATAADAVWYVYGVRHTVVAGLVHGALLLTVVGAVLGAASGRVVRGLPLGALAGIGGALSYNALVALADPRPYGLAIPGAWVMMWFILAALDGRWLRAPAKRTWTAVAARGLTAAAAGGVAFYLVMDTLWGAPPSDGRNYAVQLVAWAFAWAPGLLALTFDRTRTHSRQPRVGAAPGVPLHADHDATTISGATLLERIDRGEALHILDVRFEMEFAGGHVPGAVNIPFAQVPSRIADVPGAADEELILYCGHGPRAYIASTALRHAGRTRIVYLTGHWAGWRASGLRVER